MLRFVALRIVSSFQWTVVCLLFLAVLTFWGTVYQVEHGLYAAQHRMFFTWFFLAGGFFPFPGVRLVLWALFFNLVISLFFRYKLSIFKLGIWLIHLGIILLLVAGAVTFHLAQESNLTLREGEASNVTADYHEWELALWTQTGSADTVFRDVQAVDVSGISVGETVIFSQIGAEVEIVEYHPNCDAFTGTNESQKSLNISGISRFGAKTPDPDPAGNLPGMVLEIAPRDGAASKRVLLYGGELRPTPVVLAGKPLFCRLRHKRYPMPLAIRLLDFRVEHHPGTRIAKSYESSVSVNTGNLEREVLIYMNHPLRHDDFTFYQASFSQSQQGETSTLAVVRHPGRLLPYISSLAIGGGLVLHFVMMLFRYGRRTREAGRAQQP